MISKWISGCRTFVRGLFSPAMHAQIQHVRKSADCWKSSGAAGDRRSLIPVRYPADWRSLAFLSLLSVGFFIQWSGLVRHWSILVCTCLLSFIACIIKHNHIHCRTFASLPWNRVFEFLLSFCTGQSTAAIIPVHTERHHAQFHTDADCVRSSLVSFRSNWLNLLVFPFVVVKAVHRNKASDLTRWRRDKPNLYRCVQQERGAVLVFGTLLLLLNWRATLNYIAVPWMFGQWSIVTINLLQHQDCDHGSSYDHSRNITGGFINWLFLNNGFHTAHHLRPAMHWSRLPAFHRQMVEPKMRPELNHRSLLACVWQQFFCGAHRRQP